MENLGDKANNTEVNGKNFQSPEFDLDATDNFNLEEILDYNLPVMLITF
jgi:hypothetical protein